MRWQTFNDVCCDDLIYVFPQPVRFQLCYITFFLRSVAIGKTETLFTLRQRIVQAFLSAEFSCTRILKHILGKPYALCCRRMFLSFLG